MSYIVSTPKISQKQSHPKQQKKSYPHEDVFDGLGCLKGELHLEIDHKVRPVQQLLRRTPIPIKERVTTAIREMEQKGITAKVTEPTPWISNMVVTEKKDKLRICLEPGCPQ